MQKLSTYLKVLAASLVFVATAATAANARHVQIVAFGASIYAGYGVGRSAAFPAILEATLKKRGYDVTVINAGVSGNTSADLLARVNSDIPPGTSIVILGAPRFNDRRRGISPQKTRANMAAIHRRLRARGIKIVSGQLGILMKGMPRADRQPDGIHPNRAGQAYLARRLLPQVIAAIPRN